MKNIHVRRHIRRKPTILYRGASSRSLSARGLERTAGISFMPSTDNDGVARVYAQDHAMYYGGKPVVVKFRSAGLKVEKDTAVDFQWNVLEDRIPKKNILAVEDV